MQPRKQKTGQTHLRKTSKKNTIVLIFFKNRYFPPNLNKTKKNTNFDLQNPPQTPPKPIKSDPKSSPGAPKSPSGEHYEYKHEKMRPESCPRGAKETPNPSQTPLKMEAGGSQKH